jgi:hypothetical protein
MKSAIFMSNEQYWQTLAARLKSAPHVDAAIAYFGQGGAKLFPLRRGDRIVLDMSVATVQAGATDPREVEKLIRRGVRAFTRRNLHSKMVVAGNCVIAGSANVSQRSYRLLDEAAVLTTDASVIRRAADFIDRLCTEPIRPKYLKECKRFYRPPRFVGQVRGGNPQLRVKHAKLWIVNLTEYSIPEAEVKRYERGEAKAEKLRKNSRSKTESFHWPKKPRMADELDRGDWIIQVISDACKNISVHPPGQLLFVDSYVRNSKSDKSRYVFHLEIPKQGQTMTWKRFGWAARGILGSGRTAPRTRPVPGR